MNDYSEVAKRYGTRLLTARGNTSQVRSLPSERFSSVCLVAVHKGSKRVEARKLRAAHFSLKTIAARLDIAKSTASLWLRDMPSATALARGRQGNKDLGNQSHQRAVARLRRWRQEADQLWFSYRTEPLFMLGLGLYWGEGSKTTKSLRICNNDPKLIKIWLAWCAKYLPDVEHYGRVYVHEDVDELTARRYWSRVAQIPIDGKSVVLKCRKDRSATRISTRGTLHLRAGAGSTEWFVKTMHWISKLNANVV